MKEQNYETRPQLTRAVVLHVELPPERLESSTIQLRNEKSRLDEAVNLTEALPIEIVHSDIAILKKINPKTLIGGGRVEELLPIIDAKEVQLIIVNALLSPAQQRNLEIAWDTKVIDRTHLILEIFADRARTKAGTLQVALAQQIYLQGRLVRAWTHLERQRGGMGKTGGPGERQIELDKRMIRDRIKKIKDDLKQIEKERSQQRAGRKKSGIPVVSLVGYTNAGKSTLFNAIMTAVTEEEMQDAMVKDMLFATLDPLMRKVKLPSGREIIISDTVGFVSDLPHQLVESFKSTLEEVCMSDLLLHVHDASSNDFKAQEADVDEVLKSIKAHEIPVLHVENKCDLGQVVEARGVDVSALTGEGIEKLLEKIEEKLSVDEQVREIKIFAADGKRLAWLHRNAQVMDEHFEEDKMILKVKISDELFGAFSKV